MIRPMQASDIPRVAEIRVFGWRYAYRGIISDEHLFNELLVTKQIARLEEQRHSYERNRYVYDDGIIKAFLAAGPCGDDDKPEAFELGALYVEPCLQGGGIGTALAVFCEQVAGKRNYGEICLWTFEKNTPARTFYEKLGYTPDGTIKIVEPYGVAGVRYCKKL